MNYFLFSMLEGDDILCQNSIMCTLFVVCPIILSCAQYVLYTLVCPPRPPLTALSAWCKQCLPGQWKPHVLCPGIEEMRESMVVTTTAMHGIIIHPPPPSRRVLLLGLNHPQPSKDSDRFAELVTFMSHVAPCYKAETKDFGPQLKSLLERHGPVLVRGQGASKPPARPPARPPPHFFCLFLLFLLRFSYMFAFFSIVS